MAFALLIIGITLVVAAVRNTHRNLISLVWSDFTGPANFWYWIAALLMIGAIGYVPKLKPISDGLLIVIILALLLSRGNPDLPANKQTGGFFKLLTDALGTTQANTQPSTVATSNTDTPGAITSPGQWTTIYDSNGNPTVISPTGR